MNFRGRLPGQLRSLGRFPVPVASAVVLALLLNLQIADVIAIGDVREAQVIFALVGASLAAVTVDLWASSRHLSTATTIGVSVAAAAAVAALQVFHGRLYDQSLVVIGALLLATMVAAHLRRDASIEAFWRFNLKLGIAAAMGVLALLVVCGGLSLLLDSLEYLFDVRIAGDADSHIWVTGATLIAPLFALAMIPAEVDQPFVAGTDPDLLERAVATVLNFALAPLVLAYALMLHVYAARIAVTATMPKGEVGWLVLAFGIVGTAAYMVAYPWRQAGSRAVRWLMVSWFWLMVIPALLLMIAVWQRIAQYGVTPERYGLCLFALWLAAMAAYLGARRGRMDLRVIPASLAAGLLLSSFGPWGAVAISVRSQLRELHRRLQDEKLLADDRLRLDPPRLETFNRISSSDKRLLSILKELDKLDALDRVAPLFAAIEDDPFKTSRAAGDLNKALALYPEFQYQPPKPVGEAGNSIALRFDVGRYDQMLGPIWVGHDGLTAGDPDSPQQSDIEIGGVRASVWGAFMTVQGRGASVTFDFDPIIAQTKADPKTRRQTVLLPAREGSDRAMLVIVPSSPGISGNRMQAWILLGNSVPNPK